MNIKHQTFKNFIAKTLCVAVVAIAVLCFNSWAIQANEADARVQAQIDAAERAAQRGPFSVADGSYQGSAKGYGGDVVVEVTVSNGYIEKLELISAEDEDKAWLDMARELLTTIPDEQTTDVDVISDATYTSAGIINATRAALKSAPAAE